MPITVDHILVPARDRHAAANWLGDLLGIEVTDRSAGSPAGYFAVVRVGQVAVDFADSDHVQGTHIAFLVSDTEFDAILERVVECGLEYTADPGHTRAGELNDNEGGRGFYILDPDDNNYEFITRSLETPGGVGGRRRHAPHPSMMPTDDDRPTVAVLGTGSIGTAIASVLASHGHAVRAWNRSPQRTSAAAATGATVHSSAHEAADGADLVLVTVTNYDAVEAILDALQSPLDASTLGVLTTGTPAQAVQAAQRGTALGFASLDVGVQAAPENIGTPIATFLFAGDQAAFERHRLVFERLGTSRFVSESPSAAAIWDLALFGVWYDAQLGLLRALNAIVTHGIDARAFADTARVQLGHAAESAPATADELIRGEFPRGPADLSEHLPVLEQLSELHAKGPLRDGGVAGIAQRTRAMIEAGYGADGLTGLLREGLTERSLREPS